MLIALHRHSSLRCCIETEDMADMAEKLHVFETSSFETRHPLYFRQNHHVFAKFKRDVVTSSE